MFDATRSLLAAGVTLAGNQHLDARRQRVRIDGEVAESIGNIGGGFLCERGGAAGGRVQTHSSPSSSAWSVSRSRPRRSITRSLPR